jgi:uncharacterized protein YcbX
MQIGTIEAIFRYPIKSLRGESLATAELGFHGIEGDRRSAFRKVGDRSDFPFLTAGRLPSLVCMLPHEANAEEISKQFGAPVELMHFKNGLFDDACVSVITSTTVGEVCGLAGRAADARRFRPNILVKSGLAKAFEEDEWVGATLRFGEAAVAVTLRDLRCAMINIDPDTGGLHPEMMKAAVRANDNHAGVYGATVRPGRLTVGQAVYLDRTSHTIP